MVPKKAIQIVDRLLQELMGNNLPFGGKIILFGGDFRQVLPAVRHGNRVSIAEASIKHAPVWRTVRSSEGD